MKGYGELSPFSRQCIGPIMDSLEDGIRGHDRLDDVVLKAKVCSRIKDIPLSLFGDLVGIGGWYCKLSI